MNTGNTKVMFSCSMKDKVEEKGKWPCGVCKKGVGNNASQWENGKFDPAIFGPDFDGT